MQLFRKTCGVFAVIFAVVCLCVMPIVSDAATLEWDRNAETDMDHYNVYVCSPAPCTVTTTSTKSANVLQTTIGVLPNFALPAGIAGSAAVTATDSSGNESGLSVSVPFDSQAPAIPTRPHVK